MLFDNGETIDLVDPESPHGIVVFCVGMRANVERLFGLLHLGPQIQQGLFDGGRNFGIVSGFG